MPTIAVSGSSAPILSRSTVKRCSPSSCIARLVWFISVVVSLVAGALIEPGLQDDLCSHRIQHRFLRAPMDALRAQLGAGLAGAEEFVDVCHRQTKAFLDAVAEFFGEMRDFVRTLVLVMRLADHELHRLPFGAQFVHGGPALGIGFDLQGRHWMGKAEAA